MDKLEALERGETVPKKRKKRGEAEREALKRFEEALLQLKDPRRAQGLRYPLQSVVTIALMAMVCSCDDAEAIELWGKYNKTWLKGFLELPHGVPTQDVYLSVFAALDPKGFSQVFVAWVGLLQLRLTEQGKHSAVDGKTSRRSFDTASGKVAVHTVSAYLSEAGCVVGQHKTGEKSNEIKAVPELLALLDLSGATVTMDAMGCQTETAAVIVDRGGDYLLAVKDNQPTLHKEVIETFREASDPRRRAYDEAPAPVVETYCTTEKGHGRLEERIVRVCRDLTWVMDRERWKSLAVVVEVESRRTDQSSGKTSTEKRHYIGSHKEGGAEKLGGLIRRHWGIENEVHWVLDMAFNEDRARHRAGNCADNFATLRHFALNLLKQERTCKVGVATKRKRAGWDRSYLIQVLTNAQEN